MFYHTGDIERAADRAGSFWFSPSSMRFFKSRVLGDTYGEGGRVFITSEQGPHTPRLYSIRIVIPANPDNGDRFRIDTVPLEDGSEGFQAYRTRSQAIAAALRRFGKLRAAAA